MCHVIKVKIYNKDHFIKQKNTRQDKKKNTFNKVKVSKLEMNDLTYVAKEAESEMKLKKKWTNKIKWMNGQISITNKN